MQDFEIYSDTMQDHIIGVAELMTNGIGYAESWSDLPFGLDIAEDPKFKIHTVMNMECENVPAEKLEAVKQEIIEYLINEYWEERT